MENAETILVVILSTVFIINLILMLVLLSIAIKIANHVRHITEKIEVISDKAEHFAGFFGKAGTSVALAKVVSAVTDAIRGASKNKSKKSGE